MREWLAQPKWKDPIADPPRVECLKAYDARGGQGLMDYVVPGGPPGVVMSRHVEKTSMPLVMATSVTEKLVRGGCLRLLIGHTPHGNCPTIIRERPVGGFNNFLTIMADTSYSDMSLSLIHI